MGNDVGRISAKDFEGVEDCTFLHLSLLLPLCVPPPK
jgi:hypothetical protein